MKYIYRDEVSNGDSKLAGIANMACNSVVKSKIPVYESVEEFINYNYLHSDLDTKKLAKKLYEEASDMEKGLDGSEVVMYRCHRIVERQIRDEREKMQNSLLKDATHVDDGKYLVIKYEQVGYHDDSYGVSLGLYTTKDVAKKCLDIIMEKRPYLQDKEIFVEDENGNSIVIEDERE